MDGILYEPRALWTVGRIDTSVATAGPVSTRLRGGENDLLNGEKYPVTLRYLLISPISYLFDEYSNSAGLTAANFRNNRAACLDFSRVIVSVRQRHYTTRFPVTAAVIGNQPTWNPPNLTAVGATSLFGPGVFNNYSWQFDKAMILGRTANCEFIISGYPWAGVGYTAGNAPTDAVRARIHFSEVGGARYHGNVRTVDVPLLSTSRPQFGQDGFGAPAGAVETTQAYPPQSQFVPRAFSQQAVSGYGPSTPVVGFGVGLQQQGYDDAIRAAAGTPAGSTGRIASIGNSVGVVARTLPGQGGTGAYWWRRGAPLCLVCPTQTSAMVYPLPEPITLEPGDSLEVQFDVPPADPTDYISQLGVSFCGEAAITA